MADVLPKDKPATGGEVALAGKDGDRLGHVIDRAQSEGLKVLYDITRQALERHLNHGPAAVVVSHGLYTAEEKTQLTNALDSTISTGDLLGRSRVREKMRKAEAISGLHRFADNAETPWAFFPDTIPVLPPQQAVAYFKRLVPSLSVDPTRYGQAMQRVAFTLAHATETTLLSKIQSLILDQLNTASDWNGTPANIEKILADAGIAPTNPQYASMVFRTNMMDSYVVGQTLEVQENPEVAGFFPVWQYLGIRDGREGEDHRPHFGKYYPSTLPFHTIRGKRVYNCRCLPSWIDKYHWSDLQRQGAVLSYA